MVAIQIHKGQGISQAILQQLKSSGVDTSKLNKSIWTQIIGEVTSQQGSNSTSTASTSNNQSIFSGGNNINGSSSKNFVVKPNETINISDSLWNNISSLVSGKASNIKPSASTGSVNSVQKTDTPAIKEAKAGCADDINTLKASGVNVTDWDKNNTCTLTYNGKQATISIDQNGKTTFGGDIDYIMNHLEENPKEKASVDSQTSILNGITQNGDTIQGNPKMKDVKIQGKDTQVLDYTVQSKDGKPYEVYLDNNGKQVTPDS